ncbi:MAG: hypothetical protein NC348_08090, partial [Clostridium sp.]|nr:hypothetical protein [Clostridium sp.]
MKLVSTGISISSINRIKELAEQKEYAEALKILDTQDLDKSINPQFLRISGEIFRENKRYYDSRKILLKSHQMSPMGTRIIFELIQLYLELGYYTRAKRYYEQYQFYSSEEDVQKDYVEYLMKKATGAAAKELASILIPILERMPEDKWNFEAVLLYDKLGRKDKALEESQYILENFKNSVYVKPIIEYIDDKLDVDKYFYVFPREEQPEDKELFGDLIEQEEKLLQADYLRMYPPEAKILVEAEDKDAVDVKPAKKKESAKKRKKKNKKNENAEDLPEDIPKQSDEDDDNHQEKEEKTAEEPEEKSEEEKAAEEQERIKQEREAALEKLLSKKIDKEKIRESAKQVAKAVKDIDTTKAKTQVMSVAESVKENVKKATDALGEAVGTKQSQDNDFGINVESPKLADEEQIVDGIIESVLEPPKKAVGQVVMNEELDAIIPDSLEAMSAEEVAEIEAKKQEAERLELEALEASLKLEEEKKAKKMSGKASSEETQGTENESDKEQETGENVFVASAKSLSETEIKMEESSFEEKKAEFLANLNEEEEQQPLDSLGFITVVQSDVDSLMEEQIPETADLLHQMIDNKEYYSGEDSTRFESKASYDEYEFEVENLDFASYRTTDIQQTPVEGDEQGNKEQDNNLDKKPTVEIIFAEEKTIIDFDEIVPTAVFTDEYVLKEEKLEEATIAEETIPEEKVYEEIITEENIFSGTTPEEEASKTDNLVNDELGATIPEENIYREVIAEETVFKEITPEEEAPKVDAFMDDEPEEALLEENIY